MCVAHIGVYYRGAIPVPQRLRGVAGRAVRMDQVPRPVLLRTGTIYRYTHLGSGHHDWSVAPLGGLHPIGLGLYRPSGGFDYYPLGHLPLRLLRVPHRLPDPNRRQHVYR